MRILTTMFERAPFEIVNSLLIVRFATVKLMKKHFLRITSWKINSLKRIYRLKVMHMKMKWQLKYLILRFRSSRILTVIYTRAIFQIVDSFLIIHF